MLGTGSLAEWILLMLDERLVKVVVCFDNLSERRDYQGIPVCRPDYRPGMPVIIASMHQETLGRQLLDLGYKKEDLIIFSD